MFRPVNRSSSGLQQNKSPVLFRYWDPNILQLFTTVKYWDPNFTVVNNCKILGSQYLNSTGDLFCWRPDDDLLTGENM